VWNEISHTHSLFVQNLVKYLNDRHDKRMDKLEEMLEDRKTQLEHHNTGRRRLSPEDHERVSRQAVNYERKLKQLRNLDPDERADMMQHEADAFFRLNSVDYLDFPEL